MTFATQKMLVKYQKLFYCLFFQALKRLIIMVLGKSNYKIVYLYEMFACQLQNKPISGISSNPLKV